MTKKPEMYHNVINKEIKNNMMVYKSYNNKIDNYSVREKINKIINSNNFIYSKCCLLGALIASSTSALKLSPLIKPISATWPPDSA